MEGSLSVCYNTERLLSYYKIMESFMEERITVRMTKEYLFDFTLYHTYSKFSGFLTSILGVAIAFMGIIMFAVGKIEAAKIPFYLIAAIIFTGYTPCLLKYRAKNQVRQIDRYRVSNEVVFNEDGIHISYEDKEEIYEWKQIQKVVTTPKTIGFYYGAEQALIVPKTDFGDKFVSIMSMAVQKLGPEKVHFR